MAEIVVCNENAFEYYIGEDGRACIEGIKEFVNPDEKKMSVVIPEQIDGRITDIGKLAFFGQSELVQVSMPDTIKSIRERAFGFCEQLKDIIIADGVQFVEDSAFVGCKKMERVIVGKNVARIHNNAFEDCKKLKEFVVAQDNNSLCSDEQGIVYDKEKTKILFIPPAITNKNIKVPETVCELSAFAISTIKLSRLHLSLENYESVVDTKGRIKLNAQLVENRIRFSEAQPNETR